MPADVWNELAEGSRRLQFSVEQLVERRRERVDELEQRVRELEARTMRKQRLTLLRGGRGDAR